MARPIKEDSAIIEERDRLIMLMAQQRYSLKYLTVFFNLSKGRVSKIKNRNEVPTGLKKRVGK